MFFLFCQYHPKAFQRQGDKGKYFLLSISFHMRTASFRSAESGGGEIPPLSLAGFLIFSTTTFDSLEFEQVQVAIGTNKSI